MLVFEMFVFYLYDEKKQIIELKINEQKNTENKV